MRANGATLSWTSAHSIEKLLLPLSVMTVGVPEPTQRIWSRRPPMSTSRPVGGGAGTESCASSATAHASKHRHSRSVRNSRLIVVLRELASDQRAHSESESATQDSYRYPAQGAVAALAQPAGLVAG